jgi:hypothetical protein
VAEAPAPIETPTPYETAVLAHPMAPPATGNGNGKAPGQFPQTPWVAAPTATAVAEPEVAVAPEPEVAIVPEPEVVAPEPEVAVAPEPEVVAAPEPVVQRESAFDPDESTRWLREAAASVPIDVDAAAPVDPGSSQRQGAIKHRITQFLLWMVQVEDETDRYTLGQAVTLVRRAMRSAFAVILDPIDREVFKRWHRWREDWRRSGETVAKQKSRTAKHKSATRAK